MRTVKVLLRDMMPGARIFLDKDDLKTGAGARYVDASNVVLVYCTEKYFLSRACARELLRAVLRRKPLIAVLEPDHGRGAMSLAEIQRKLLVEIFPPHGSPKGTKATCSWATKWRLDGEVKKWGYKRIPTGEEIAASLFAKDAIEWNRLTAFQQVSLRLIAERLLPEHQQGRVYVQCELGSRPPPAPPLTRDRLYHFYCSKYNIGAQNVAIELQNIVQGDTRLSKRRMPISASSLPLSRNSSSIRNSSRSSSRGRQPSTSDPIEKAIQFTNDINGLDRCEHMLIYLTSRTWTSGDRTNAFYAVVRHENRTNVVVASQTKAPRAETVSSRSVVYNL